MAEESLTKFRSDVLLQEYLRLCTEIRSIESMNERIIALSLTLISSAAAIGLAQAVDTIFFILPIAFIGVVAFGGTSYVSIYSLAGYKRYLEDVINETLSEKLLLWEQLVPVRERRNLLGRLMLLIYFIIGVSVCILSIYRLWEAYAPRVALGMVAGILVLLTILFVGIRRMATTLDETYAHSKRLHDASISPA